MNRGISLSNHEHNFYITFTLLRKYIFFSNTHKSSFLKYAYYYEKYGYYFFKVHVLIILFKYFN